MAVINQTVKQVRLTRREKLSYGMGSLGNNLIYGLMTAYLMAYYTDTFLLPTAAIGLLFLIARSWDAISDPFIGFIVDNTYTRFGRFRPYLLFVPFIMGAVIILLFSSPNLPVSGKIIWAYVTYILWGMAFAFMDIPFWSMSATLTQDPQERSSLIMIPRTFATFGIIAANVITLPLVGLFGGNNPKKGWLWLAVFLAALCIIFTLITFFNVKERNFHTTREMLADTVEYGEWKTGKRQEGMIFSTNIFKTKIASAISGLACALILTFFKYVPDTTQTVSTMNGIHAAFTIIPGIISLLSLIPLCLYDLNEEKYLEMLQELRIRNEQLTCGNKI